MSTPSSTPMIDGYDDLSLIGEGGFSQVFLANQLKLKRQVAIKVLKFGLDDPRKRRAFERETELMARVSMHPNIVPIHDTAFTEHGQPCIVMGHYQGGSLGELINRAGALSTKEAIEVGIAVASALDASHDAGIVHCDIKPQNILISSYGQPALADFGISTFADERTQTGQADAGFTLAYAAPEVVEGESPSVTTDVYSLAATLYASLAGHRPFARPTDEQGKVAISEQARRILLDKLAPLPSAPPELDAAIRHAMSRKPEQRPSSAAQFASQLYEIGQQLGLAISVPRTSDRAALPTSVASGDVAASDLTEPAIAPPVIDPTRLLTETRPAALHAQPVANVPLAPNIASPGARVSGLVKPLLLVAGLALAALVVVWSLGAADDPVISGPAVLQAGTIAVYTVPDADPGTVRWVDWNDQIVIEDALELAAVVPGRLQFSAVVDGETHTRQVTIEPSALGPVLEGPSSLRVGESGTYTATSSGAATLVWNASTGETSTGSTFAVSQVADGTIVQVIATDADGVARGAQLRIRVDS